MRGSGTSASPRGRGDGAPPSTGRVERADAGGGGLSGRVRRGDEDTVKELVDSGVDLNGDVSPFFYARTRGMVKLLVDSGANVNHIGHLRGTPLMSAARWQSPEIVAALLGAHADVDAAASGTTALIEAVSALQPETVRLLLRAGARVNAVDENGKSALRHALAARETARGAPSAELDEIIALLRAAGAK